MGQRMAIKLTLMAANQSGQVGHSPARNSSPLARPQNARPKCHKCKRAKGGRPETAGEDAPLGRPSVCGASEQHWFYWCSIGTSSIGSIGDSVWKLVGQNFCFNTRCLCAVLCALLVCCALLLVCARTAPAHSLQLGANCHRSLPTGAHLPPAVWGQSCSKRNQNGDCQTSDVNPPAQHNKELPTCHWASCSAARSAT